MCWHRLKRFQHPSLCSGPHSLRLCVQGQSTGLTLVEPESRFSSQPAHQKQQSHRKGGFVVLWWSRRESNPRPQALYRQFYILRETQIKSNLIASDSVM